MSPDDRLNNIEQRMDEAFAAGPGSKEEQELLLFLFQHGEYQSLWREYQTLRKGMDMLQATGAPSEMTRARIRHVARERLKTLPTGKRGWRRLLSQPVVAAATVLLVVGFGIYSQYLFRQERKIEQKLPTTEQGYLPGSKPVETLGQPKQVQEAKPELAPAKKITPAEKFKQESPPAPVAPEALAPAPASKPASAKATAPQTPAGAAGSGLMQPLEQRERAADSAAEPAQAVTPELKAQRITPPSRYELLLSQAKEKITARDCPGALKLLKEAQQLEDTPEIHELFKKCEIK